MSASKAFPSSRSSSTLSESAASRSDNPCRSPDWPPDRDLRPSRVKAAVSTMGLLGAGCFLEALALFGAVFFLLPRFAFAAGFFLRAGLFLASFFEAFFRGAFFFFFAFFLVAIGAVYHRAGPTCIRGEG